MHFWKDFAKKKKEIHTAEIFTFKNYWWLTKEVKSKQKKLKTKLMR